jgi:type IV pilus modification protein PilV
MIRVNPLRSRNCENRESGFTLVEVLVAILIVAIGIVAVFGSLASSSHLTSRSQVQEAAVGFAEQQIEKLRQQYTFASLGMSATPSASANTSDPNYYVSTNSGGTACYQIDDNYQGASGQRWCETFVTGSSSPAPTCGATCVAATPQTISSYPGLSGTYDIYVTWHQEAPSSLLGNGCLPSGFGGGACLTGNEEKRITVAVLPSNNTGNGVSPANRKPIWISSVVADPSPQAVSLP